MARNQIHGRVSLEMSDKKMQNNLWLHYKGKSDLVIFHVRDILRSVTLEKIQQIHKYPFPRQRMAFLTHESIDNEADLKNRLSWSEGFFNWTVTYKRESDISILMEVMFPCRQLRDQRKFLTMQLRKTNLCYGLFPIVEELEIST